MTPQGVFVGIKSQNHLYLEWKEWGNTMDTWHVHVHVLLEVAVSVGSHDHIW